MAEQISLPEYTTSPLRLIPYQERLQTPVKDQYGRAMTYLRISLTDRCNFRCLYCMPANGMQFQPRDESLTDDELLRAVRLSAAVGFRKFRLTGGEPTVRPHLVDLVRAMKAMPGVEEISMTTNALLLGKLAQPLADAGLSRVNISIDTLDPVRFRFMTRGGRLDLVWKGIEAASEAGLTPIKLNTVVVKDQNDHDVVPMAELTLERPWQVRFLEIMPLEGVGEVHDEGLVTSQQTQDRLEARFGPLEPVEADAADPARLFRIKGAAGTIGFISPISEPFCAACNRIRLTADGKLRLCLLRGDEVDLRDMMRAGATDDDVINTIRGGVWRKPWGHGIAEGDRNTVRGMSQIGG